MTTCFYAMKFHSDQAQVILKLAKCWPKLSCKSRVIRGDTLR